MSRAPSGVCRRCGCSDADACMTPARLPCAWVDGARTKCSACFDPSGEPLPRGERLVKVAPAFLAMVIRLGVSEGLIPVNVPGDLDVLEARVVDGQIHLRVSSSAWQDGAGAAWADLLSFDPKFRRPGYGAAH